jgi:hypothetical protein
MINFICLSVPPGSRVIACAPPPQHHIRPSPWTYSTSPFAICTPQTQTKPGRLGFRFCSPNAAPRSFSHSPPTAPSNSASTPAPVLPLPVACNFFDGQAISGTRTQYSSFGDQNPIPARSVDCSLLPPQPAYQYHTRYSLYMPRLAFSTGRRYRLCLLGIRFFWSKPPTPT